MEHRLDPGYYHPSFLTVIKRLRRTRYPLKSIRDIAEITAGSTPKEWARDDDGILFLKTVNIRDGYLDLNRKYFIPRQVHTHLLKRSQLKPRDILLTIVGATFEVIGRAAVVPDDFPEANINQAIAKISLIADVNSHYVETFLNSSYGQAQIQRLARPVAQININQREVTSILIPIPPRPVQDKIASLMLSAHNVKEQRLYDSAELLSGISDYVLQKLGIRLSAIHAGPFSICSRDVSGRLDVEYYQPHYRTLQRQLSELSIPVSKLEDLI